MKKIMVLCAVVAAFFAVSVGEASACPKTGDQPCPFMAMEHAKELGLTGKQKSQLKGIQKSFKADMQALGTKYGDQTSAVLTDAQKVKYNSIQMPCDKGSGGCCGDAKHKGHKKGDKDANSCQEKK
ncbi:MAG: hypothetical protein Q7T03_07270 [Deltaproteobacteria bacterium]|nr:hypothetical protein [Deltaproteobacteria bacterium]